MKHRPRDSQSLTRAKSGFTLVEMLVATTLVVLMMLLFAQIFQTSGGIVSNQKGLAKNDQSVRTMTILLRGDIRQRTFVDVVPFVRDQDTSPIGGAPQFNQDAEKGYAALQRQGFFSISENDPDDPTDDVLHLTIRTDSPLAKSLRLPFSGKSRVLYAPGATPPDLDAYLTQNPDQPEYDDGQLNVNNTGSSRYAEVCWFLRHGKLYRRILLIRDPYYRGTPPNPSSADVPRDNADNPLIGAFYDHDQNGTPDAFWRDFDYSAYWEPGEGLKFHTNPESLVNQFGDVASLAGGMGGAPRSLGNPAYRFGSSTNRYEYNATTGNRKIYPPREYITDGTNTRFIGRFTVQETADTDFKYPGGFDIATNANDYTDNDPFNFAPAATPNPKANPPGRTLSIDAQTGLVSPYHNESNRRGEDVVMSDVHEFDIQVWDDGLSPPQFVNLGHSGTTGYYRSAARVNPDFGNSYDTWHPSPAMPEFPPYAPFEPAPGLARSDYPSNGLGASGEVWLKAIRIKMRFYDIGSEQMRDMTFTFRLNRENSSN